VSAKGGKRAAKAKPAKEPKPKRVSLLDAAAMYLAESPTPLKCIDIIIGLEKFGIWKRGSGKTPEATLYAAVIREIAAKGREARFKKTDRRAFASIPTARKGA
jgi:hypothetical protein